MIDQNGTGVLFPSGLGNSGEALDFYGGQFDENGVAVNAMGSGEDFYFYGTSFDFSGPNGTGAGPAIVSSSGNPILQFYGCHFEEASGQFISITGGGTVALDIFGGVMAVDENGGSDADLIGFAGTNSSLVIEGLFLDLKPTHQVGELVDFTAAGSPLLSISDLGPNGGSYAIPPVQAGLAPFTNEHIQDVPGNGYSVTTANGGSISTDFPGAAYGLIYNALEAPTAGGACWQSAGSPDYLGGYTGKICVARDGESGYDSELDFYTESSQSPTFADGSVKQMTLGAGGSLQWGGGPPIASSDDVATMGAGGLVAGSIVIQGAAAGSMAFPSPYPVPPICVASPAGQTQPGPTPAWAVSTTVSAAVVSLASASSAEFDVICFPAKSAAGPLPLLSPPGLAFGDRDLFTQGAPQTITIENIGTAPLAIRSIAATGDYIEDGACAASLPPGASCGVSVAFRPTAPGARTGSLEIVAGAPGASYTAALSGYGVAPAPAFSRSSLDFGGVPVGGSASRRIRLSNGHGVPFFIFSVTAPPGFSVADNCGQHLVGGGSCDLRVTFAPTGIRRYSGALTVTGNLPGGSLAVRLSGEGRPRIIQRANRSRGRPSGATARGGPAGSGVALAPAAGQRRGVRPHPPWDRGGLARPACMAHPLGISQLHPAGRRRPSASLPGPA
ncbi:MAG: choice-of-anchor D domain-containing protein, partial [Terriglobales bacterium]